MRSGDRPAVRPVEVPGGTNKVLMGSMRSCEAERGHHEGDLREGQFLAESA
jgi:hypothetical protein